MSAGNVLRVAAGEIGYVETPVNRTKYCDWYGLTGPWCDMWVSWCAAKAGESRAIGKFASTAAHLAWFRRNGRVISRSAPRKPGDLIFYGWGQSTPNHIEFFERRRADGRNQTIGGNTSTGTSIMARRMGGGVVRLARSEYGIVGVARPAYSGATVQQAAPLRDAYPFPGVLQSGSHGTAVARVQRKVGVLADGKFGSGTARAVVAWQRRHGLRGDGIVGRITWSVMF